MLKDLVVASKVCMGKSKETSGNEYSVVLKYNGNSISMLYHDNYKNKSDKDEFLYALLLDGVAYENCYNLADFMDEFGYEDKTKATKAYNACKRQCEKLHRLFTYEEIEQELGVKKKNISQVVHGKRKKTKGYHFEFVIQH